MAIISLFGKSKTILKKTKLETHIIEFKTYVKLNQASEEYWGKNRCRLMEQNSLK